MKKKDILEQLRKIKENGFSAMIQTEIPGYKHTEDMIIHSEDLDVKIAYIDAHYNKDGEHENNNSIKIIAVGEIGI